MSAERIYIPEEFLTESICHTDGKAWWGGEFPQHDNKGAYPFRHFLVRRDTRDNSAQVIELERDQARHLFDKLSLESVARNMGATVEPGYEDRARMREEMLTQFAPATEMPE
jgi:hypothetical protein